jgi:hypothetical protein
VFFENGADALDTQLGLIWDLATVTSVADDIPNRPSGRTRTALVGAPCQPFVSIPQYVEFDG